MATMNDEFRQRRQRVLEAIDPGVLVVFAAPTHIRNNDVEHEYRQDSDFFYLSGFDEPESVLVLSSRSEQPYTLFVRPRDPEREQWDGLRAGLEGAVRDFGADAAVSIEELAGKLPELLRDVPRLFYRLGFDRAADERVLDALARLRRRAKTGIGAPTSIVDPSTVVHELRAVKSTAELDLMRRAIAITAEAHLEAMARCRPGMYEYEIEAVLRAVFRKHGSERPAYEPIVGSGPNATILHHRRNDRQMLDGELLLIDAGCEYGYYASDVTRTFPINGRFTPAQRRLYELVLEAHAASVSATRAGVTLNEIHDAAVAVIAPGLCELGLIEGPAEVAIAEERYKRYFMHKTSHYLGMDVHDVGAYFVDGAPRRLEPGMVITIEPNIYVPADATGAAEAYRGIGIRIEDDVLVTDGGREVLSAEIPRQVADIEHACAR